MGTDSSLNELAIQVGNGLLEDGSMLNTAESCTGGWISKVCTDIEGSSRWFDRGFVTYSNAAKQDMLHVPETVLMEHGAVSEPVVRAMASGALQKGSAEYSVAVSGIAGPGGGTVDKPVGLVWLAWAHPHGVDSVSHVFQGDREAVRRQTVEAALRGILERLA